MNADFGMTMNRIRVLLADDHPAMLVQIESLLKDEFDVIGKVADGQALVDMGAELQPEVIIADITMPIVDGIEAARRLRAAGNPSKIVFLSVHEDADFVNAALDAGGDGYVVKSRLATDLIGAIRDAIAGSQFVSPTISRG
jgi:DNA-binding NarL/FixJ family response regulator